MDIHEIRKQNLINQIGDFESHGAVAAFARKHNLDPTYVRQIINNHRKMGEKAARKFEESLSLKNLALDTPLKIEEPSASYFSKPALAIAEAFDNSSPELQEAALRMLGVVQDIDMKSREK